eukprot:jgi/Botrbrau1/19947/Bobra.0059s0064.1
MAGCKARSQGPFLNTFRGGRQLLSHRMFKMLRTRECHSSTSGADRIWARRRLGAGKIWATRGGFGQDDTDFAVFRFTLGIPGFDDALIPRAVGVIGGLGLLFNHVLGTANPSGAQVRAEVLGAILVAVCWVTPDVEQYLKEKRSGRGKAALSVPQGSQLSFLLLPGLPESLKQELAWASYALLLNTNTVGLLVYARGRVVVARGLLGAAAAPTASPEAALLSLQQALQSSAGQGQLLDAVLSGTKDNLYLPNQASMRQEAQRDLRNQPSSLSSDLWGWCPDAAGSLLVQAIAPLSFPNRGPPSGKPDQATPCPEGVDGQLEAGATGRGQPQGVVLLFGNPASPPSERDRRWARAIAGKLWDVLAAHAEIVQPVLQEK